MGAEKTLVNDMSQGPVLKGLIRFAIPMMLANLLQAVYSMVDMIVVGQFGGPAGLSAVGIGGQLTNLFLAVGMGFSNGAQVVISQQVGMKSKKISKTIGTLLTTELILAVIGTAHSSEATSILPSASRNSCTKSAPVPYTQDERIMICLVHRLLTICSPASLDLP